jgi:hypothetical protein
MGLTPIGGGGGMNIPSALLIYGEKKRAEIKIIQNNRFFTIDFPFC